MPLPRALFAAASQAAQAAARREFQRSSIGKVIQGIRRDYRSGIRETAKLEQALIDLERNGLGGALRTLEGGSLNGLVNEIIGLLTATLPVWGARWEAKPGSAPRRAIFDNSSQFPQRQSVNGRLRGNCRLRRRTG